MIPLTRRTSSRRFETTLLSYSRQSLPRPFRLYTTPTKRSNAPGPDLGTASVPSPDFPAFMNMQKPQNAVGSSIDLSGELNLKYADMKGFLRKRTPYTILPTPLPDDASSESNDIHFTDTLTQDSVAVIDACLHNLYDVPRAQGVFDRLRAAKPDDPIFDDRLYNSILHAYLQMATTKESLRRNHWVEDACALYESMEAGNDVAPTGSTYALLLLVWHRFHPDSANPVSRTIDLYTPSQLLRCITDRGISVTMVVSDPVFQDSEEAAAIIKLLSKAAVEMNLSKVVSELGAAEILGSQIPDPLVDVPEAIPVLKPKKPVLAVTHNAEGEIVSVDVVEQPAQVEYEVPFNLTNLRKHLAAVTLHRRVLPEDASARQKLLEESVYDVAVERWKHEAEMFEELGLGKKGLDSTDLRGWLWQWHQKLQMRVAGEIQNLIKAEMALTERNAGSRLSPFLTLIKPEKLSLITILELMHLQGAGGVSDGMKTARALISVGKAVEIEYKAEMCKKNNIAVPSPATQRQQSFFSNLGYRALHERRLAARKYMEDYEEWTSEWTQTIRVRVGSFLVDALMDVATVSRTAIDKHGELHTEEQPAFYHSYEYLRGQKLGVIKLNPVVADRLAKDQVRETLHPRHLPMLVRPKPWLSHDQGGYLYNKTSVMRYKDSREQQSYVREASSQGALELVYASLDVLGGTPWKINRHIFDVVLKVWNSGERLGKIPPAMYDQPEPEKPADHDTDPKAKVAYLQRHKAYMSKKANNHSDRCNTNYKIEIARAFLGDTVYLPHNVDFRGRAYPIPPNLNHLGDDLSRGLLKFAEAKPLGERGLRWMKIHLANLYGYDKASFDERVVFVHEHLDDIFDSATNPLEGRGWWKKADDPWQCLATCMEIRAALESPEPTEYASSLPVHQDGTCNGLQHYAALGGDAQGAQQVNLSVTDRPSDVYTHVATMVESVLAQDAKNDLRYAKMLSGKIARKVVKQTVMTTVYGVTFIGARDQIERQLRDRRDLPAEECWLAAAYLAKITLACIGDLFTGAKHIQNWLNLSAKLISKSIPPERIEEATKPSAKKGRVETRLKKEQMTSVIWTTPLGLPIVQPYRQTKRKQIHTALQTVFISDPNVPAAVNSTKQASAFPPNFIHSLDATHMMLTALQCRNRDITFASVHDSYWTHACSVDEMSEIIRETFIALHSSDVMAKLDEEFRERYKGYKVPVSALRTGTFMKQLNDVSVESLGEARSEEIIAQHEQQERDEREEAEAVDLESGEKPKPMKRTKRGKTKLVLPKHIQDIVEGTSEEAADYKFVDLVDLFPPLPQKGSFDVTTIKKSLYFFS
ncbi:uncharacterized protein PHACADRAFT_261459 [Phanerochaete carnosa HHB-10118-sp]|uniref:DNA-directed RNA polymerase n=1 Tax=Phanerochaete carnosa (strain HHB-10118-sp) TaxID=650164 RepID=K5W1S5_PHACS|nr:uncharacterized protein PHACADRAFT_261459 [Phanerochaete carnosa HHB-10118-sp]EKM52814.1 hypothetical protein PHACADRAFT_261459 [Phanerochaete carnosa HHB-10118-sp]